MLKKVFPDWETWLSGFRQVTISEMTDSNTNSSPDKGLDQGVLKPESPPSADFSGLRRLFSYASKVALLCLVLVATYFAVGRILTPLIGGQRDLIESQLSDALGSQVSIEKLSGRWFQFGPILSLENLSISFPASTDSSEEVLDLIQNLHIKLDVLSSILQRSLVIEEISINELTIELEEDESGRWSLAGLRNSGADNNDALIDLVLNIADLKLSETTVVLHRTSNASLTLNNVFLQLQNNEFSHHLEAQLRFQEQASPLHFSLELNGDPREQFTATGYLSFNNLDVGSLLEANADSKAKLSHLESSAQLWFEYGENAHWVIQGEINEFHLQGALTDTELLADISSGRVDITVVQGEQEQWQIWLEQVQFDFNQYPWEAGDFFLALDLQEAAPSLDLSAGEIDLEAISNILNSLALPESAQDSLDLVHPSGKLKSVLFGIDLSNTPSGKYSNLFELSANLEEVAAGAWSGAPSGIGINGYVQADLVSGFVELNSQDFEIHLPRVFKDSWHYDFINGRVHWYATNEKIQVNSSVIDVENEGIHGRVQFDLGTVRNESGGWDAQISILVGALNLDASQKALYLPTLSSIENTMSWIDGALIAGDVSNSGFVFRGAVAGNPVGSNTVQTFYNTENAILEFLPDWPLLENITGFVKVSNNDVDIVAQSAEISGISLGATAAIIRPNLEAEGVLLSVNGHSQTTTELGLEFIRNSPVKETVGDYVNNWQAEGQVGIDIELVIPLNNQTLENNIQVAVMSEGSTLVMPDYGLNFEDIRGLVNFSNETGLMSEGLSGSLFDFPIASRIEPFSKQAEGSNANETGTKFLTSGRASIMALQNWSGQSDFVGTILNSVQGEIEYQSEFQLFSEPSAEGVLSRLTLSSDLPGVELDLPMPFKKGLDDIRSMEIEIEFRENRKHFNIFYDESFYSRVFFENNELLGGQVYFGNLNQDFDIREAIDSNEALTREPGFLISGDLGYVNYEDWSNFSDSFTLEDDEQNSSSSFAESIRLIDLDIATLDVFDVELEQVNTQIRRSDGVWNIFLKNDLLAGTFDFPDETELPYEIHLDYLSFPEVEEKEVPEGMSQEEFDASKEEQEEIDYLADIDPSQLPNFNFTTSRLSIGERDLGEWEFSFRTNGSGATISNFKMQAEDALISDVSTEAGANIDWRYMNGMHTSSFNGLLHAGDLAVVLPSWGFNANVQSERADFVSNLQWTGSPAAFSVVGSSGQVAVDISKGRFVDINSDSARLFGAFNFDSIVRRLQLDFSDLYEKGLAYDKISGKLVFNDGIVTTDGNFLIQGPSSTINIDGEIDLENETIDADMLVNIPFSQNISMIAGLLSAWPVAIGTYVAGKVFKDQLAEFTTVLYRLEGPWSELEAGFESDKSAIEEEMIEVGVSP